MSQRSSSSVASGFTSTPGRPCASFSQSAKRSCDVTLATVEAFRRADCWAYSMMETSLKSSVAMGKSHLGWTRFQ